MKENYTENARTGPNYSKVDEHFARAQFSARVFGFCESAKKLIAQEGTGNAGDGGTSGCTAKHWGIFQAFREGTGDTGNTGDARTPGPPSTPGAQEIKFQSEAAKPWADALAVSTKHSLWEKTIRRVPVAQILRHVTR